MSDSNPLSNNVDSSLLAFGASASVNLDLKRVICQEIEEIDKTETKTRQVYDVELQMQQQLNKGRTHVHNEMIALHQASQHTLEAMQVGRDVLQGLQITIQDNFDATTPSTTPTAHPTETQQDGSSMMTMTSNSTAVLWQEQEVRRQATTAQFLAPSRVADAQRELSNLLQEHRQLSTETSRVKQLQDRLAALQRDHQQAEQVQREVQLRRQALDESLRRQTDEKCQAEEELEQSTASLTQRQLEYRTKAQTRQESVVAARQEVLDLEQHNEKLQSELEQWIRHRDAANVQVEQAKGLIQERQLHQDQAAELRTQRQQLFAQKRQIGDTLLASKAELDRVRREIAHEEDVAATLRSELAHMDREDAIQYAPMKIEKEQITTDLQNLEVLMESIQANPEKVQLDAETVQTTDRIQRAQVELEQLQAEAKREDARAEEFHQARSNYRNASTLLKKLETNVTSQHQMLQSHRQLEVTHAETACKVFVYQQGAALLQATAEQEQQLDVGL